MPIDDKSFVHFVGIGGIGMSGLARILLEKGCRVSGSDLERNSLIEKIEALGAKVCKGHRASNVPRDAGVVVYSSSIPKDNPELKEALKRKIRMVHRAEMLGELFNKRDGIGVTGTHGKTTTTSLISVMLEKLGMDPTVIIGGEVDYFRGNAKLGKGRYVVAEADESDSSFLNLRPFYAVITNIEMEHIDHFRTLDDAKAAYSSFIGNLKDGGKVFYNYDDPNLRGLLDPSTAPSPACAGESFGLSGGADIHAVDIKMNGFDTAFKCVYKNTVLGEARLKIPGRHNILNALAAILAGLNAGLVFDDIADSIRDFTGAKRRFQLRLEKDGVMLIDDYAHHPTEIRAVLSAARNWGNKRIIVIFQPHRYTRTKFLADEFGRCFEGTDILILTDIYAASERPIKGISIKNIYDKVRSSGIKGVEIVKKEDVADHVVRIKRPGDMIFVLGAGDIKKVADRLYEKMAAAPVDGGLAGEIKKIVKGKVSAEERLLGRTSFRIGGPADAWVEPNDLNELKKVLVFALSRKVPVFVMGNGSNVLVRDNGFRGIVVHLGAPSFRRVELKGCEVRVGAGFSLPRLVALCCDKALGGLESLVGIPGSVGGAIYMNAGGYSNPIYKNISGAVASLKVMDYKGRVKNLRGEDIKFGYRRSSLNPYIIVEAALRLEKGDRKILASSRDSFLKMKAQKQVLDMASAGCVFKNPVGSQFTCGQMIDMLGLKGRRVGGAEISTRHANFIVNRGDATCEDVLALVGLIREKAKESYGLPLELEIKVI